RCLQCCPAYSRSNREALRLLSLTFLKEYDRINIMSLPRSTRLKLTAAGTTLFAAGAVTAVEPPQIAHNYHVTQENDKLTAELGKALTGAYNPRETSVENQEREVAVLKQFKISPDSVDLFLLPNGEYDPQDVASAIEAKDIQGVANVIDSQTQAETDQ